MPTFTMDWFTPFHPSFGYIETNFSSFVPHFLAFTLPQDSSFRPLHRLPHSLYDTHPPPAHPYLHGFRQHSSSTCAPLNSTLQISITSGLGTPLCCHLGCATIETAHHAFVQCPAFLEIRGSHLRTLVQATSDLTSAEPPCVGEDLCAVARYFLCDDVDVLPQVHSMYYLGVLLSLAEVCRSRNVCV